MFQVIIQRSGVEEKYILYPSGLLIPTDGTTDELPRLTPGSSVFNRMVEVNKLIRPLMGAKAAAVGEVNPV